MEFLVRAQNTRSRGTRPTRSAPGSRRASAPAPTSCAPPASLKRLWRVPGRNATLGLYEVVDATELHDALASLPMFPWMDITVEAMATHPQEQ